MIHGLRLCLAGKQLLAAIRFVAAPIKARRIAFGYRSEPRLLRNSHVSSSRCQNLFWGEGLMDAATMKHRVAAPIKARSEIATAGVNSEMHPCDADALQQVNTGYSPLAHARSYGPKLSRMSTTSRSQLRGRESSNRTAHAFGGLP